MARSEARVLVEIWDDDDFLALSPTAQRMFLFLISQRDLEHTGVLALRERRWAKGAAGMTSGDITRDLGELEGARFIVMDEDTEELLVRSFIRRDKVFKQPNVMRSAADRAAVVKSRRIQEELLVELQRIAETEPMPDSAAVVVEELREALAKSTGNPCRNPSDKGSGKGSRDPSAEGSPEGTELRPGERGVVTTVTTDSPSPTPQTSGNDVDEPRHDEEESTTKRRKRSDKDGKLPSTHPKLTWSDKEIDADPEWAAFWTAYPKKDDKGQARKTWLTVLRNKDVTANRLAAGALRYREDSRRNTGYTKNASTWLNAEAWNNYDVDIAEPARDPDAFWDA